MKGFLGAASVIDSFMYEAGHVFKGHDDSLRLRNSQPDTEFGRLLNRSNCLTSPHLLPLVIAEALQDYVSHYSTRYVGSI